MTPSQKALRGGAKWHETEIEVNWTPFRQNQAYQPLDSAAAAAAAVAVAVAVAVAAEGAAAAVAVAAVAVAVVVVAAAAGVVVGGGGGRITATGGSFGQPGRHQGGRKGVSGRPARRQGGTREAALLVTYRANIMKHLWRQETKDQRILYCAYLLDNPVVPDN